MGQWTIIGFFIEWQRKMRMQLNVTAPLSVKESLTKPVFHGETLLPQKTP